MNYKKVEELFVDFILDLIGPTSERENERNKNISIIGNILINIFNIQLPDYNTYILPYGSFPSKTYLKNGDIDLTILLEIKSSKKIFLEIPINLINKTFIIIKDEFEKYNKKISFDLFTDIKIIIADISLLKCKIGAIPLDISINNFAGLYKLLFINYIENQFTISFDKNKLFCDNLYSNNKIIIFRRTLLLIKAWLFYEGNLMGSNIGLMANYTLEILIIYIFNFHYEYIFNEFDGFEKFFEILETINLDKNLISLYGIISKLNFYNALSKFNSEVLKSKDVNQPFWYLNNQYKDINDTQGNNLNEKNEIINCTNKPLLNIDEIKKFIITINNSSGNIYLKKDLKIINIANYNKPVNILDPLNNHNNLGKSLNIHNYSRMKKVIIFINKKLKIIKEIRKNGNPFLYINSLLNLFELTVSNIFIELFSETLTTSKILAKSKIFKKSSNLQEKKIKIDKENIKKFNSLFLGKENINKIKNLEIEDYDNYDEEKSEENNCDEEQDEYAAEEKEEYEDEDEDEDEEDEGDKYNKKYNNIFPNIINNEIINKLFELKDNTQKSIDYNILLLKKSEDYSHILENFLKEHKLLS